MRPLFAVTATLVALLGLGLTGLRAADEAEKETKTKTETVKVKDLTLDVPTTWDQQPPSNNLRLAQFVIPAAKGDKEPAELVVSSFGGGGGGVEANVKRWIGQFQEDGRKSKVTLGESEQGKYVLVELAGTYNKPDGPPFLRKTIPQPGSRMIGVILQIPNEGVYFLKTTGYDKTVAAAVDDIRAAFGADAESEKELELK